MQNRQNLEAQKLVMLTQHLWPLHDTPPSITSFQTQTLLQSILDAQGHVQLGAEDLMVKEKNPFETGDKIEVYMGQLKGVVATVRKILENGTMLVEPRLGDLGIGKIGTRFVVIH